MVKSHLWGILNAIIHKATNAIAESFNATIQKIKARACYNEPICQYTV